jgi:TRAP-type mannitol/chloroaromatic compound transport system permease small subunit
MLESTIKYGKLSATPLRTPLWIPHLALVVGFAILTLQYIILTGTKLKIVTGQTKEEGEQA